MHSRRFEVVRTQPGAPAPASAPRPRASAAGPFVAGLVLLMLGGALAFALHRQLGDAHSSFDRAALVQASGVLERSIEQQRRSLLSVVGVLADDTRVRASVMTPDFNEATVKDTLSDLKTASGASVLAVLDLEGKVRAVTGAESLRHLDLGSTPLIKTAAEKPAAQVWTFPQHVLVVAAAPIHSGADASALFMMGFELGEATLGGLRDMLGVDGAVLIGDRIVATTAKDAALAPLLRRAAALEEGASHLVAADGAGPRYLARVTRTSSSATAGKVVLLVPQHHQAAKTALLGAMVWTPALLGVLAFVLVLVVVRRADHGGRS